MQNSLSKTHGDAAPLRPRRDGQLRLGRLDLRLAQIENMWLMKFVANGHQAGALAVHARCVKRSLCFRHRKKTTHQVQLLEVPITLPLEEGLLIYRLALHQSILFACSTFIHNHSESTSQ